MPDQAPRRGGRPPRVNRGQVVAAAAALLAEGGPNGFSMRSLAARLDMSPMGIYHYFDSKNDLLSATLAHQSWGDSIPELPAEPFDRVLAVSVAVIDHLARHPWIVDLQVSSESVDPFTAWGADRTLAALEELGMSAERRVSFLAALWRLVLAEATVRAGTARVTADTGRSEYESLVERFRGFEDLPDLQRTLGSAQGAVERFRIDAVIRSLLTCALAEPDD